MAALGFEWKIYPCLILFEVSSLIDISIILMEFLISCPQNTVQEDQSPCILIGPFLKLLHGRLLLLSSWMLGLSLVKQQIFLYGKAIHIQNGNLYILNLGPIVERNIPR